MMDKQMKKPPIHPINQNTQSPNIAQHRATVPRHIHSMPAAVPFVVLIRDVVMIVNDE
jgi:hypothetical protein